ncbi:negative regulator of flagellin synthesis LfgM [Duganella sp. Leaf126]|uniref:flagellar biosynthesis anti-sigma factor FlgM n=1 Tax=Duganella sp. Leaf126 TaxID=1736266 RepID=UPI0006FAB155|nr:flagellar biosynthesis anti-sigma factor FlgM [Duganella sp. Leaf126]KQQ36123.1 negative regulator of flagellin synthesis LfgM [Duganella sp. Leaf126]
MRITTSSPDGMAVQRTAETAPVDGAEAPAAPSASATAAPLQSAVMQPALQAMRDMPEIDQEKVDMLRDALAKGELPFDPAKLAGLIQRFHGVEK